MVPVDEVCERTIYKREDIKERFTNLMARTLRKSSHYREIEEPVLSKSKRGILNVLFAYFSFNQMYFINTGAPLLYKQ